MPNGIEELKAQWKADPCWDIEDTPGFEEYRDTLYIFRLEHERDALKKRVEELRTLPVVERLESLGRRVLALEKAQRF